MPRVYTKNTLVNFNKPSGYALVFIKITSCIISYTRPFCFTHCITITYAVHVHTCTLNNEYALINGVLLTTRQYPSTVHVHIMFNIHVLQNTYCTTVSIGNGLHLLLGLLLTLTTVATGVCNSIIIKHTETHHVQYMTCTCTCMCIHVHVHVRVYMYIKSGTSLLMDSLGTHKMSLIIKVSYNYILFMYKYCTCIPNE